MKQTIEHCIECGEDLIKAWIDHIFDELEEKIKQLKDHIDYLKDSDKSLREYIAELKERISELEEETKHLIDLNEYLSENLGECTDDNRRFQAQLSGKVVVQTEDKQYLQDFIYSLDVGLDMMKDSKTYRVLIIEK